MKVNSYNVIDTWNNFCLLSFTSKLLKLNKSVHVVLQGNDYKNQSTVQILTLWLFKKKSYETRAAPWMIDAVLERFDSKMTTGFPQKRQYNIDLIGIE